MSRCQGKKAESLFFPACFFSLIAFSVGCIWVLVCRGRRYPVSATPTHMLRICVNSHDDPLLSRGEHCSPAKNHKVTFLLSYFCMTKRMVRGGAATSERRRRDGVYQKSSKRVFPSLIYLFPRARVSRASHAWRVCAAQDRAKVGGFTALRNLDYTTRANIAHEEAEQIRARIVCTPAEKCVAGVNLVCALTG